MNKTLLRILPAVLAVPMMAFIGTSAEATTTPQVVASIADARTGGFEYDPRPDADSFMRMSYREFVEQKRSLLLPSPYPSTFDWSSDGCSGPGNGFIARAAYKDTFRKPCQQHDFGYRNYGSPESGGLRLSPTRATRQWIDDRLRTEMRRACEQQKGDGGVWSDFWNGAQKRACLIEAEAVYRVVRAEGDEYFWH